MIALLNSKINSIPTALGYFMNGIPKRMIDSFEKVLNGYNWILHE
jgi:hypothetical protein